VFAMSVCNLDEDGNYWYRKSESHPRADFEAVALRFRTHTAGMLSIPEPPLHWYEAANKHEASA